MNEVIGSESRYPLKEVLATAFVSAYAFFSINRLLKPGLDGRFVLIIIGALVCLYAWAVFRGSGKLRASRETLALLAFTGAAVFSNVSWVNNPYPANVDVLTNSVVLLAFNVLTCIVVVAYGAHVSKGVLRATVHSALAVLLASLLAQKMGYALPFVDGNAARDLLEQDLTPFGIRVGGYAEDPNYAALYMMAWIFFLLEERMPSAWRWTLVVVATLGFLMSFSKTLALFMLLGVTLRSRLRKWLSSGRAMLVLLVVAVAGVATVSALTSDLSTIGLRLLMWMATLEDFFRNPIFGSGTTSARSNFESTEFGWYVQIHSTYLTLLYEYGLVGTFLFFRAIRHRLQRFESFHYLHLTAFALLAIFFTYDMVVFPFWVLLLYVMPLALEKS